MRKLLVSTFASLVFVAPVAAQDVQKPPASPAPQDKTATAPNTDQHEGDSLAQSIEDALRTRLANAGFTDIEMMPMSFLVRAKDADGKAVMLVLSPDSVAEYKQGGSDGQDDASTNGPAVQQEKF